LEATEKELTTKMKFFRNSFLLMKLLATVAAAASEWMKGRMKRILKIP
jgi:hypothetical protein